MLANTLEQEGIPTVLVTNLVTVARTMHVNRVFAGMAIPHILGNPTLPPAEESALRRGLVERALQLLTQPAASSGAA